MPSELDYRDLEQLRRRHPAWRLLAATLLAHRPLWGREPAGQRHLGALTQLNEPERALYEDLCEDRIGERLRLEQERLGFGWVRDSLAALPAPATASPAPPASTRSTI